MKTMKRVLGVAMALTMAVFAVGCSTPAVALSVGGIDYSTAEYLAYLYQNASQVYNYYSYFSDVSTMWSQTLPYENPYDFSEEEESSETSEVTETTTTATGSETETETEEEGLLLADYIKEATKDQMVYFAALQTLLDENGLSISEEDLAEADSDLSTYSEEELLEKGFSLENFRKAYINSAYLEETVMMGMYGKDGKDATKQADIDDYFDENYLAYEIIQISLEDSDGNALTDEEIAEIKAELEGYRNVYYATGDFDEAIAAYDASTASDSEDEDTTEYDTDYAGTPQENVTSNNSDNVQTVDAASDSADADLVKLIRSVEEGEVALTEYKQDGESNMAVLIYRVDPDGTGRETYREDSEDTIIQTLRQDDFEQLVQAKMDAQKDSLKINSRAVKMCDPVDFFE